MYLIKPLLEPQLINVTLMEANDGVWMQGRYQSDDLLDGVSYISFNGLPSTLSMSLITPVVAALLSGVTVDAMLVQQQIYAQASGLCYSLLRELHHHTQLGAVVDYGNDICIMVNLQLADNYLKGEVMLIAGIEFIPAKLEFERSVTQLTLPTEATPTPPLVAPNPNRHKLH